MTETDVDTYGFLSGGTSGLIKSAELHSWREPFPSVPDPILVSWEPGSLGMRSSILRHNLLRDFVVDNQALQVLLREAGGDIRVYAKMVADGTELSVLQVTSVLDVVDIDRSIPSRYTWADISFPYISKSYDSVIEGRIFKVPNPGVGMSVFVGDSIKRACESNGITGWLFNEVLS